MYRLDDENAAIAEVQGYLYLLSNTTHPEIPRVAVDGIWGAETEIAVAAFQRMHRQKETGKVDYETFEALYYEYSVALSNLNAREYIISYQGFPLKRNMMNDDVLLLHLLISEIQKEYGYLTEVNKSTYYSETTERAVLELQRIFGVEENGEVDANMLSRLIFEMDSIKGANADYV